ncbi:hypothetical protein P4S72_06350 [Vibrio sp. PP-XX7]
MQQKFIIPCIAMALGATGAIAATDNSSTTTAGSACQNMDHLYFCDDFTTQDFSHWQQLATEVVPDGVFDIPEGQDIYGILPAGKGRSYWQRMPSKPLPSNGSTL